MRKNEGITLIALIITIIILVILAAVTINNTIGSNVIDFATQSAKNYIEEGKREEYEADKLLGILDNSGVADESIVRAGKIVEKTEKDNYTDVIGKTATIPQGFKVSTKSSEQYIDDGLVIQDEQGNEFVWIPCTTTQYEKAKNDVIDEDWERNNQYTTNGGTDGKGWRDNYRDDDKTTLDKVYTGENKLPTDTWENDQITVGSTSIGNYGGFYIARYEAGIPENASFYFKNIGDENNYVTTLGLTIPTSDSYGGTSHFRGSVTDTNIIRDLKPVSKQGMQAWNYITQPNSKMVAENMYKEGKDDAGNVVGVRSYLVDSQAWNHICKNIYKAVQGQSNNDSTTYGNYFDNRTFITKPGTLWARHILNSTGLRLSIATKYTTDEVLYSNQNDSIYECTELATGSSDNFRKYNIYDMAGNMWEWTTAHNINNGLMNVVVRGGTFFVVIGDNGGTTVVRAQGDGNSVSCTLAVGFRVVLYIK